jgi:hypothetical protein
VESVNNAIAFALFGSGSTLILHGKKENRNGLHVNFCFVQVVWMYGA